MFHGFTVLAIQHSIYSINQNVNPNICRPHVDLNEGESHKRSRAETWDDISIIGLAL
jgi:hypothetical protein